MSLPASNAPSGPVLFFDGECGLCNRIVRLLLWLDDHLLIDTAQRGLAAPLNYSFAAGARPPALPL
mgnify:CR=1 FL=1